MAKTSQQISMQILLDGNRAINTLDKIQQSIKKLDKEAARLTKKKDLTGAAKAKEEAPKTADEYRKLAERLEA